MTIVGKLTVAAGLAMLAAGCVPTSGANLSSRFDPTGLSSVARSAASAADQGDTDSDTPHSPDLGLLAPRLEAVAAGDLSRPDMAGAIDSQRNQAMAIQMLGLAASAANAGIGAAMSGGTSLISSAPSLALQAAGTAFTASQMSAASSQVRGAMAQAEVERKAKRIVPDEDRPTEARAILSIIDGKAGRTANWANPASGSSGKVTIRTLGNTAMPGDIRCRMVDQEWRNAGSSRRGHSMVCASRGIWYDLS